MSAPSVKTLKQAVSIAEKIRQLESQLADVLKQIPGGGGLLAATATNGRRKPRFSKAARAKIAAAQKKRWAKQKGSAAKPAAKAKKPKARRKGKMSAAGRANIVKAQKARWAKAKAGKA